MRTTFLLLLAFVFLSRLSAQDCNCAAQFEFLTQKIATNYSGYADKVNPQTQAAFDAHTLHYRELTAATRVDTTCARLLLEWTLFFKDRHVQLTYNFPKEDPVTVRQRYLAWERIPLGETEARQQIDRPGGDPAEGIWEMSGGNYRVALIESPTPERDLAAVVLRADSVYWVPGQIKFDLKKNGEAYTARFYMRDHSMKTLDASLSGDQLIFKGFSNWQRVYPGNGKLPAAAPKQIFTLRQLDSTTVLLTVPTMNENVRLELDSLIKANRKLLARTPNMIIDVRGNGGGSDVTYYPLKPYLYTQKVTGDRMQFWATRDNAEKFALMGKNKNFPWSWRMYGKYMARRLRRHEGHFVGKAGTFTERVKHPKKYPLRVAVLINGGCASSCEEFVLFARQSKKTTLIGQPTGGVLDYGNLHFLDFPDPRFTIGYPTSRSNRVAAGRPVDNIGIAPEIRLTEADGDWVEWARKYLSGK